jgi:hypothetical protein
VTRQEDRQVDAMVNAIEELEHSFEPNAAQRRIRAKLNVLVIDNPLLSIEDMEPLQLAELLKEPRISRWWHVDGFKDWFTNRYDFKQRTEELIDKAYSALGRILDSDDPKMAGAQVNAAKMLVEVGNKLPSKIREVKFSDETINKMNPLQLEEYLNKAGYARITEQKPLCIEGETVNNNEEGDGKAG